MRTAPAAALAVALAAGCAAPTPRELHEAAIVVDTHADTTPYFEDPDFDFAERHAATETHVDLPRLREGGVDAQFWSIYLGRREGEGRAAKEALERIDAVHELVRRHDDLVLARTADDVRRAAAAGHIASLMGVEGGHIIEESLAVLRSYHRLGVRYLTLTHSFPTSWADSSGTREDAEPVHGGLTAFGERVVREMNRLGMMVDVSHVSDATFDDVLRVSRAPIVASHSSCRALADHRRNLSDDMLRRLAAAGGVVMINFYPAYLDEGAAAGTRAWAERHGPALRELAGRHAGRPHALRRARRAFLAEHPPPTVPLEVLVEHVEHALREAGPDHVGLGADWDGVPSMPEGMEDVSRLPALTEALLARGHPPATVRKVLGGNLLRVMEEVEAVARAHRDGGS